MNIETANRLVQHRKARGLSQEALADSLGLSRQAVSKWERAEASPDTDNLLALARLYGVSLDELLGNTPTVQPAPTPTLEPATPFADYQQAPRPAFGNTFDQELEQRIEQELVEVVSVSEKEREEQPGVLDRLSPGARKLLGLLGMGAFLIFFLICGFLSLLFPSIGDLYPVICTAIYLVGGFVFDWWHPGWLVYITIPFFYTFFG